MTKNCGFDHYRHLYPLSTNPLPLAVITLQITPLKIEIIRTPSVNHEQAIVTLNGRTFAYDTTELQARAIILYATREIDQEIRKSTKGRDKEFSFDILHSQFMHSSSLGFSIKRSLKRFFQRRKLRNQASSPYGKY